MNSYDSKIIKDTVLEYMRGCKNFTALDISNSLKATCDALRYSDVASTVREMFDLGMMESLGYSRELVEVTTSGGTTVQSYLYTHSRSCFSEIPKGSPSAQPLATEPAIGQSTKNAIRIAKASCRFRQPSSRRVA